MKTLRYLRAFTADGTELFGESDGQAIIHSTNYQQSAAYKSAVAGAFPRPAYFQITTTSGRIIETIIQEPSHAS